MQLTCQQRLYPVWAQTRFCGCVKLGVPVCLGATSCVSRRVSERRTPSVPQRPLLFFLKDKEKKHYSRTTHIEMKTKQIKKKMKKRMERKKNSHSRNGNTTQHTTLTSRNGEISGALAPLHSRAPTARGFSARTDRGHLPCLISNKTVRHEV